MSGKVAVLLLASSALFGFICTVAAQGGPARQPDCIPGVRGFTCDDGSCLDYGFNCDGYADCADGSDEKPCGFGNTMPGYFLCRDRSRWVANSYRCDGYDHCYDGSDEKYCDGIGKPLPAPTPASVIATCPADQFNCGTKLGTLLKTCIPNSQRCDMQDDCPNGSDERNCPCNGTAQFKCKHGKCIDSRMRCDRENNCGDRSDEAGCTTYLCKVNEKQCPDGTCVPLNRQCKTSYR